MKQFLALTAAAALATAGAQTTTTTVNAIPVTPISTGLSGVELGLTGGYAGGLSGAVFVHVPNVSGPFGVKAEASYARVSGTGAINTSDDLIVLDADRSGSRTVFALDGTYALGQVAPGTNSLVYAGGRYGLFRSVEDYGEGLSNTYSTNAFGVGAGVMLSYALGGGLSLVGDLGIDQFFRSTITQTTVRVDRTDVDTITTNDGSYDAISNRFVRPGTVFKARIGIKTGF
ncbi:hypothetical protein QOL99_11730 [Deinococcus sp. MIMF12]|uniref:Outer membrane protein beta-barrel domain-containing protein n=1 Tax=Deinococcus rhizophilus TaxID=3049544 RepID=A0ABT7JIQ0_9DEIO|nr:hypothetical protein [Deinococcus rhizophilus]MDL2344816.1 hypothetical protein [Deinococcus rhizophilus]